MAFRVPGLWFACQSRFAPAGARAWGRGGLVAGDFARRRIMNRESRWPNGYGDVSGWGDAKAGDDPTSESGVARLTREGRLLLLCYIVPLFHF